MLVDRASRLFRECFGDGPVAVAPVAGDGSARRYWRLTGPDGRSAVAAYGPDREENRAFLSFSRTFRELDLPVPEIYSADEEAGIWLEEDLGDTTLFDALRSARGSGSDRFPESALPLYRRVLEILPRFQVEGGRQIDFSVAYPRAAFDRQSILWDLNYFKYHFLKLAHVPFNEARLERDFGRLCRFLGKAPSDFFLYRDFQSRNVMVREGEPWFIDYQGGRRGALQYDVASLLYDAKANLPEPARDALVDHYLDALAGHREIDIGEFRELWPGYVLVRILQALGAYGYRGFYEQKPRFLQSVPYAARNLEELLSRGMPFEARELEGVLAFIVDRWAADQVGSASADTLSVNLSSFRFASGYPQDTTGYGGGYVFDCRGLPNPGRESAYRDLTGLDESVAAYLEARPEVEAFWERARALIDPHVEVWKRRGFHSLTVSFGCTGGQHRSVYLAERMQRHLAEAHPDVRVRLTHRERADWPPSAGASGGGAPAPEGARSLGSG